jgi:hypothetical protein
MGNMVRYYTLNQPQHKLSLALGLLRLQEEGQEMLRKIALCQGPYQRRSTADVRSTKIALQHCATTAQAADEDTTHTDYSTSDQLPKLGAQ